MGGVSGGPKEIVTSRSVALPPNALASSRSTLAAIFSGGSR
jgi:hypothetical protein